MPSNTAFNELDHEISRGRLVGFDQSALLAIEHASDRLLEEVGIIFQGDPETLDAWRQIGAQVDGERVRLDGAELRRIVRNNAPRSFTLRGRNKLRDTLLGGGSPPTFAPMYGAPDVLSADGKLTRGTRRIYHELVSIAHHSPTLQNTGHMICVMDDVKEAARPMEMLWAHLQLSDKPFMGSIASPEDVAEYSELVQAAIGRKRGEHECDLLHLVNCTPPLVYWPNPLKCMRQIARSGEAAMVSSYMMLGATAPVTVAGALIQGYAEVLAGMALCQLWNPGTPVVMGVLGWPFDMRTMLPNFSDPASKLIQIYSAELANRLSVPARGDGAVSSSKLDDGQAGMEGAMNLAMAVHSGASFVLHSAGWLQQGRCLSLAKFERDAKALSEFTERPEIIGPPQALDQGVKREIERRIALRS